MCGGCEDYQGNVLMLDNYLDMFIGIDDVISATPQWVQAICGEFVTLHTPLSNITFKSHHTKLKHLSVQYV